MIENIKFWYNNSRPYSVPITFLSWLVIFIFSMKQGGNILYGIIAYVGIAIVHLVTNLADDYFDYKRLCCDAAFLESSKDCKCKYLKDGCAGINDLKNVIIILLLIAALSGLILFFTSGWLVLIFALIGLFIALSYSWFSSRGLGDIAVIIAYGPLMFEGVYYVMTGDISTDVLVLSFACAMFVEAILYAHMLMDYDEDVVSNKTTLCTKLGSKSAALNCLMVFYVLGYVLIGIFSQIENTKLFLISFCTMPMVLDLYTLLKQYNSDKTSLPNIYFWRYPFVNKKNLANSQSASFLTRFIYARNISTYFMILVIVAFLLH